MLRYFTLFAVLCCLCLIVLKFVTNSRDEKTISPYPDWKISIWEGNRKIEADKEGIYQCHINEKQLVRLDGKKKDEEYTIIVTTIKKPGHLEAMGIPFTTKAPFFITEYDREETIVIVIRLKEKDEVYLFFNYKKPSAPVQSARAAVFL